MGSETNPYGLRVAVVWHGTVYEEKTFSATSEPVITVGESEENTFDIPAPGVTSDFEMFRRTETGIEVRFTDKVDGKIQIEGEEWSLKRLRESDRAIRGTSVITEEGSADIYTVEITQGDWGVLELGPLEIFFQAVEDKEAVPGRGWDSVDLPLLAMIFLAALVQIGLLITAFLMFSVQPDLKERKIPDRFVEFMVRDIKDPLEQEEQEEPQEDTTGKKAGGKEGKFGKEDPKKEESKIPKQDGKMKKKVDVNNIGVNKALSSNKIGSGALKNMFNNQDGFDSKMKVAMSGEGGDLQVGRGSGGMGLRGTGSGGGGEGFGRVHGLGDVDTGGGQGTGAKIGTKQERKVKPKLEKQNPKVGDFCDKGNINRTVGRKMNAIKYCYQKELQSNPKLKGKVVAQWKVDLSGKVMAPSIASSTMGNSAVESCIKRVIRRMRFQEPDGGICIIRYPFVFTGVK